MKKLKTVNFIVKTKPIFSEDVEIDKIFISNKVSSIEENYKYFIYFKDSHKIIPMYIILL